MLNSGTRFGPYEIVSAIGAGGMGEVYRARDTKLDRDVALKILPEAVAADPDRLMRFEREAKTLAALNHPNIAAIYGVEERALVMELVEGNDLAEIIGRHGHRAPAGAGPSESAGRGPAARGDGASRAMSIDDALPIARQIAEALEAAHDAGIIHRDLKPANVKVRPDGLVKVLDFGLAKALDPVGDGSGARPTDPSPSVATMTSPALTAMGMILGTAAYMSPEQAKGRPVDRRADIWAFGVVLYEMLTGRQMFQAETVTESIAAVLRADIDIDALPASTPASIRRLLARCLDRDPKTRLQHIGEARVTLAQSPGGEEEVRPAPTSSPRSVWPWVAATAAVAGTLAFVIATSLRPEPAAPKPVTFALDVEGSRFALVSPDGSRVAYRTPDDGQLWVRDLDQLEPRSLVRVEGLAAIGGPGLFWSPDGNELGYASADALWRISAEGGAPIEICRLENGSITGAAWRDDGRIIFGSWRGGLYEVAASGATEPVLVRDVPDGVVDFHGPKLLPSGALAYTLHFNETNEQPVEIVDGGRTFTLPDSAGSWYSAGHLLSTRESGSGLWATPFDLETLTVTGDPFLVVPDATSFSASFDGTLVYSTGGESGPVLSKLTWAALDGTTEALPGDAREYEELTLSPDGARVAAVVSERGESGIQLIDVARGAPVPLAALSGTEKFAPRWSTDGRYVLYVEERGFVNTIRAVPADGSRQPFDVIEGIRFDLTPDGRMLVFERDNRGRRSLWKVDLDDYRPAGEPTVLREGLEGVSVGYPAVSPDGSLVAYVQSSQFNDVDVFLSRLPDGSGQWAVSTGGGTRPGWDSATGDLLFRAAEGLVAVPVTPGEQPGIGELRTLLSRESVGDMFFGGRPVVGRDGRVLVNAPAASAANAAPVRIIVLQNWAAMFGERAR